MFIPTITKVAEFYHDFQTTFAVVFGMFVQFLFGSSKTFRIGFLIVISSLFVAMYVMPVVIEFINLIPNVKIIPDSKVSNGLYALSALMSMEILAVIIAVLPKAISIKVKKALGVPNVDDEQQI